MKDASSNKLTRNTISDHHDAALRRTDKNMVTDAKHLFVDGQTIEICSVD